jgi:hypothetical protein
MLGKIEVASFVLFLLCRSVLASGMFGIWLTVEECSMGVGAYRLECGL